MWGEYLEVLKTQPRGKAPQKNYKDYTNNYKLSDEIQQYYSHVKYLEIYQVDYPEPIEYLVPPSAILLSINNGENDSLSYYQSVLSATEKLAAFNASS